MLKLFSVEMSYERILDNTRKMILYFVTIKNVELIGKNTIEKIAKLAHTNYSKILINLRYNCKKSYIK